MNITALAGFLVVLSVIYLGVIQHTANPELFLDSHAIILVLGGTLAAALVAFPFKSLTRIITLLYSGVLFKSKTNHRQVINDIILAAWEFRRNPESLLKRRANHPFLTEGFKLVAEDIISEADLKDILMRRSNYFKKSYIDDAKTLHALAKFPPAFGLLGATTGMISMMTHLSVGGKESVGPSMAVALVATFWGIAISNFILLPLADHATKAAAEDSFTRQLIIEGLMIIKQKRPDQVVVAKLNSYLSIQNRFELLGAGNLMQAGTQVSAQGTGAASIEVTGTKRKAG